jgi:hypothetical protein
MIAERIGETEERGGEKITREEVEKIVAAVWKEMFELSDEDAGRRKEAYSAVASRLVA